jgi:ribosomal protein L37AE/L43A
VVGARIGIVIVAVSVVLGVGAAVAAGFYEQYGAVRNEPNAQAWAALAPRYVSQAQCASCHEPEVARQDASIHVDVSCEGCHGPAASHARSDEAAREVALERPASWICVTCHGSAPGRPATFATVDPTRHYSGGECLRCHDPHSITAYRPPVVTHPLANLPACTTCRPRRAQGDPRRS